MHIVTITGYNSKTFLEERCFVVALVIVNIYYNSSFIFQQNVIQVILGE